MNTKIAELLTSALIIYMEESGIRYFTVNTEMSAERLKKMLQIKYTAESITVTLLTAEETTEYLQSLYLN